MLIVAREKSKSWKVAVCCDQGPTKDEAVPEVSLPLTLCISFQIDSFQSSYWATLYSCVNYHSTIMPLGMSMQEPAPGAKSAKFVAANPLDPMLRPLEQDKVNMVCACVCV